MRLVVAAVVGMFVPAVVVPKLSLLTAVRRRRRRPSTQHQFDRRSRSMVGHFYPNSEVCRKEWSFVKNAVSS
jgi:hypothetical protein